MTADSYEGHWLSFFDLDSFLNSFLRLFARHIERKGKEQQSTGDPSKMGSRGRKIAFEVYLKALSKRLSQDHKSARDILLLKWSNIHRFKSLFKSLSSSSSSSGIYSLFFLPLKALFCVIGYS